MKRATIDFGIDLGTTNSTIAVQNGMEVSVFKNNEGFEYTPSAVWIDKQNRLIVGRRAKERFEDDRENAFCEFKLQMGMRKEYIFKRSDRKMRPEELSAEVIKSLKNDVRQRTDEDIGAAVITVPAAFELPACEATKRAAELAGLKKCPLLQEPVAAALAYGFQTESDKVFWLVYDLGGGTFDAAVINVRDGVIQVVNHGGDNELGGKLLDWAIVDQLLIPAAVSEHKLTAFNRANNKWISAMAKLKLHAEEAKIRTSRDEAVEIIIDYLCQDDRGDPVRFEYELKRAEVEKLAGPLILRSIHICKKVLEEKRLAAGDIEKVILVGGPTLAPYLREQLTDPKEGLGIPLDFHKNPLTVVAEGAAIFAAGQRIEGEVVDIVPPGQYVVNLEYTPVGTDPEPLVGGTVRGQKEEKLADFTIEFINAQAQPPWRSGKIGLSPDGTFMTNLWAEKGKENVFLIELSDGRGNPQQIEPDRLTYKFGLIPKGIPLTHSIGIALANNEMDWFFEKGTPLPAKHRDIYHTVHDVKRGESSDVIKIPVKEGQNKRADRNNEIGRLEINASQVKRDVQAGSEVEVYIAINESRIMTVKAYIPLLDEEYENVVHLEKTTPDIDKLQKGLEREKERLEKLRKAAQETGDAAARKVLLRIDGERMVHDVKAALAAARNDDDAANKCSKRLLDLAIALDEVEEILEWPKLVADSEKLLADVRKNVLRLGNDEEKQLLERHETDLKAAFLSRDPSLLRQRDAELWFFYVKFLDRVGVYQVWTFEDLVAMKSQMIDQAKAEQLIAQGQRALNNNDYEGLRVVNNQLRTLLPSPPAPPGEDRGSLGRRFVI